MKDNRNQQAHQQKAVGEKTEQGAVVHRLLHEQGDLEEREIHPFILDPLPAQQVDQADHD